ncbi:MAG: GNAT family N-acetyltransferase [Ornithinimicrobium sp.]
MSESVRMAETSDVGAIVAFGAGVVPQHYAAILGADAAQAQLAWWTSDRMQSAVTAGRVHLAVTDDAVVGVVETGEFAGEQVIWKLYLAPDRRGRSLGAELLRRAVESLPDGAGHVLVEHFAGNGGAGNFYEREGFGPYPFWWTGVKVGWVP